MEYDRPPFDLDAMISTWENPILDDVSPARATPRFEADASDAPQLLAFFNDAGAVRILVGVRKFECIGAMPPHDHPHIFLEIGDSDEIICPYCATIFGVDVALSRQETRPAGCCYRLG